MIRALVTGRDGAGTLILGLGARNLERMAAGEPIVVDLCDVAMDGTRHPPVERLVLVDASTPEELEKLMDALGRPGGGSL